MTDECREHDQHQHQPEHILERLHRLRLSPPQQAWHDEHATTATRLDETLTAACNGTKATGITVIAILFREASSWATNNLRSYAPLPDLFFHASNTVALDAAFP